MSAPAVNADGVIDDPLTDAEYDDLEKLETTISKGLDTFVEVGNALAEIRDRKLYRQYFATFAEYCSEQWDIGKSQAYRLIDAAEVVAELEKDSQTSPVGDIPSPATERQARELKGVDPAKRAAVMKKASEDGPPTTPKIRDAAAEIDPAMKLRQEQEAARAKLRAEKAAEKAEASALMEHLIDRNRREDPVARDRHREGLVRSALFAFHEIRDLPVECAAAIPPSPTQISVRLSDVDRVMAWLETYKQALESPGASVTMIRGEG